MTQKLDVYDENMFWQNAKGSLLS